MRLYTDLADWYPLLSPRADYKVEAEDLWSRLCTACGGPPKRVLELGSGAGHLMSWLVDRTEVTFTDLNPEMLPLITAHTPGARTVAGDMRTLRLGERFDAVVVHDAIDYIATEPDLRAVFATAFAHAPVVIALPDHVQETFRETHAVGGKGRAPDGRGMRYLEWSRRSPTGVVTDFVMCLLDADGQVEVVHDQHHFGLFPRQTWIACIEAAGFTGVERQQDEWRADIFVGTTARR